MRYKKNLLVLCLGLMVFIGSGCSQKLNEDQKILDDALNTKEENIVVEFDENNQIAEKISQNLNDNIIPQLKEELKTQIKDELRSELVQEVESQVKAQIKSEIKSELSKELLSQLKTEISKMDNSNQLTEAQIQNIIDAKLESSLSQLEEELRKSIRKAILKDVKDEIANKRNRESSNQLSKGGYSKESYYTIEKIGNLNISYSNQIASIDIDLRANSNIPENAIITEIELSGMISGGQAIDIKKAISLNSTKETFYTMNHLDIVNLTNKELKARDSWKISLTADKVSDLPLSWEPMIIISYKY